MERIAVMAAFLAAAATPFAQDKPRLLEPQYGVLAVDAALLLALTAVALKSDRYWPLWAAGFQLLGVVIHIARIVDPIVLPHAYYRGLSIYSYMVLAVLAYGSWTAPRARAR